MQLELRHLRALCAIADAGSLTKAAAHVGVSQPSLTAQLRRIEAALGGQIFRRGRRGVAPTLFGQYVLTRARTALLIVDELVAGAGWPGGQAGVVRVGGYATPVLSGLVRRLFESWDVAVTVHTEYSPRLLLELLAARRLDAALLVDYPGHELPPVSSVGMRGVAVEPVFVAMSDRHPRAVLEEVPLAGLADDDWVLPPPDGVGWPECFIASCQEAGFTPRVPYVVTEGAMVRQLISGGHAVCPCLATFQAEDGIVVRPIAGDPLWIRHLVAWLRDGPLAHRGEELAALAADVHRETIGARPDYTAWLARRQAAGPPER